MGTLYILRGLPGSGKTTFAQRLAKALDCNYFEADIYFMCGGEYIFDASKLHQAHKWCQGAVKCFMIEGEANIIVSNTFTTERELKPYLDMANEFGYRVVSLIVENRHGNESIHNVPQETLEKMRNRFSIKI